MQKAIVLTTINSPTEATKKFIQIEGYKVIVVGDTKTPHDEYRSLDCIYLDPESQIRLYPKLSELIGWKTDRRRNIGFVFAYRNGFDVIASVDDDNVVIDPYWGQELLINKEVFHRKVSCLHPVFDPLNFAGGDYKELWMRGYPLELVEQREIQVDRVENTKSKFTMQQDLWLGDPDICSVCRILHSPNVKKHDIDIPFTSDKFNPINSQNTFLAREVLPNYFCFPGVGRFNDLFAGYMAQAYGNKVLYNKPTVRQDRNEHDLYTDMEQEIYGYRRLLPMILDLSKDPETINKYITEKDKLALEEYRRLLK